MTWIERTAYPQFKRLTSARVLHVFWSEAERAVFAYIEGFYNPRRRHSANGQLSPAEYERRQALKNVRQDGYAAA